MAPSVIYNETQVEDINDMLPSHGENTVENTLPENVNEVSTQISDSDTPKNMEDQIIHTAEPIESNIPYLRQQKSVMKQLEQKRMPVAFFSDCTIVRSMKKKTN
jgi:hypothetical protein